MKNLTREEWTKVFGVLAAGAATALVNPEILKMHDIKDVNEIHGLVFKLSEVAEELSPKG